MINKEKVARQIAQYEVDGNEAGIAAIIDEIIKEKFDLQLLEELDEMVQNILNNQEEGNV